VIGALVIAVLDDLGERELQHLLVEADGAFGIGTDQRGVVHAAGAADRPPVHQVGVAEPGSLLVDRGPVELGVVRHVGVSGLGIPATMPG